MRITMFIFILLTTISAFCAEPTYPLKTMQGGILSLTKEQLIENLKNSLKAVRSAEKTETTIDNNDGTITVYHPLTGFGYTPQEVANSLMHIRLANVEGNWKTFCATKNMTYVDHVTDKTYDDPIFALGYWFSSLQADYVGDWPKSGYISANVGWVRPPVEAITCRK